MKSWLTARIALPLAMLATFAVMVPTASADQRDFNLNNGSALTIVNLYVSPADANDWGDDILGSGVLLSGYAVPIVFSKGLETCQYDIMVRGQGGEEGYMYKVDLCSVTDVTFS